MVPLLVTKLSILAAVALPVSIVDIRERRIPNFLVLVGLAATTIAAVIFRESAFGIVTGAAAGLTVFLLVRFLTRGRMGLGDVKYSAFLGAICGLYGWICAVFVASLLGLMIGLTLLLVDRRFATVRIPFAPFLSVGGIAGVVISYLHVNLVAFGGLG